MTDMSTISDKSNTSAERVKPDVALDGMMASFMEGFGCAAEAIHEGNNVHPKSWVNYWPNSQAHADWFAAVTTPALTPDALAPIPAGEVAELVERLRERSTSTWRVGGSQLVPLELVDAAADLLSRMAGERDSRQQRVAEWCAAAFGADHQASVPQRGLRFLEEAIEAYQALGGDPAQAHKLVDYIYAKEPGNLFQELGGVGVTLLALAAAAGLSAEDAETTEIARVLSKPLEHFWARNKVKNDAGFDALAYPSEAPK